MVHELPALPADWQNVLKEELLKDYYQRLSAEVEMRYASHRVYPPARQLFSAFELCSFKSLRVLILGQDPYHSAGQAHGLCFSVNDGVSVPPSLRNIYKELEQDLPGFVIPKTGNLSAWARQGVLLLNAVLTVSEGAAGSHRSLGWEKFTDAVISAVSSQKEAVVFLLWGNFAIAKKPLIDESKHLVLTAPHPSPLARGGFSGCRHFSRTNVWLEQRGLPPIDWRL